MKFDNHIQTKYIRSVEDAFAAIIAKGNDEHSRVARSILDSEMLVRVEPVAKINASGVTGLIDAGDTNDRIADERLSIIEALGEVYICIAEETIDTGGQRGCEGTFVHEGRHAFDFAKTIASFSNADVNPLSIFDPTLYELEWEAHRTAGEYMLMVGVDEYLHEGLDLMILGREENGPCFLNNDGICQRLRESYGLDLNGNHGRTASEILGLRLK